MFGAGARQLACGWAGGDLAPTTECERGRSSLLCPYRKTLDSPLTPENKHFPHGHTTPWLTGVANASHLGTGGSQPTWKSSVLSWSRAACWFLQHEWVDEWTTFLEATEVIVSLSGHVHCMGHLSACCSVGSPGCPGAPRQEPCLCPRVRFLWSSRGEPLSILGRQNRQ